MNSLFSDHDILNIHKILGFGCLAHYGYRIYNKFMYGTMFFDTSSIVTYVTPALHLSLSLSSFIFHVPVNRFKSKTIIWKELQLHNIVFTSRSAFMMYHTLFFNSSDPYYYYTRLAIMLSHHYLADLISQKYQIDDKTTTRDIPYDTDSQLIKWGIKKFYALSQLVALFNLSITQNYDNGFLIMFPIQLSTFLMTLVRKNIISNNQWHMFYGVSLLIPYLANIKSYHTKNENVYLSFIFIGLRLGLNLNKYINMIGLNTFYAFMKA